MKFNCVLLNLLLGLIIIIGAAICCVNCNFGGISKQELKKDYILKNSIKFKNLPSKERKKYILKKSMFQIDESSISVNSGSMDENKINSVKKLREIIKNLKSEISIIQNDNIQLSDDKEDIQKMNIKIKKEFKKQRDKIIKQNIQRINDTEQQHYENISELTKKINDLQRENIKLSEDNDIEIIALKAKINTLNDKLSKLKRQINRK